MYRTYLCNDHTHVLSTASAYEPQCRLCFPAYGMHPTLVSSWQTFIAMDTLTHSLTPHGVPRDMQNRQRRNRRRSVKIIVWQVWNGEGGTVAGYTSEVAFPTHAGTWKMASHGNYTCAVIRRLMAIKHAEENGNWEFVVNEMEETQRVLFSTEEYAYGAEGCKNRHAPQYWHCYAIARMCFNHFTIHLFMAVWAHASVQSLRIQVVHTLMYQKCIQSSTCKKHLAPSDSIFHTCLH